VSPPFSLLLIFVNTKYSILGTYNSELQEKIPCCNTQQKKPLPRCGLYSKEKNRRQLSLPTALILLAEQG
jgi:hypothetical protein